jgi:hypothetical protein
VLSLAKLDSREVEIRRVGLKIGEFRESDQYPIISDCLFRTVLKPDLHIRRPSCRIAGELQEFLFDQAGARVGAKCCLPARNAP